MHRAAAVAAINAFRREHGLDSLAVCGRMAEYSVLDIKLKLQGAILVQPLTLSQIDDYLAADGDRFAALHMALREDAGVAHVEVPAREQKQRINVIKNNGNL